MSDLLIRNIDLHLKRRLEESARAHRRSLSEEARMLLKQALREPPKQLQKGLGTAMRALIPKECLGDDLVFEVPGEVSEPPDFR